MSNAVAPLEPQSIIATVAKTYGMHPKRFEETLRATVLGQCSNEELAAFLIVCREYELNPLLKEIYAYPKKDGGIQPIVGVDGWAKMVSRHPQADGMSFEDRFDNDMNLVSVTCRMFRKDRAHPIEATEYLKECKQNTIPWQKWPHRMLRHKAMIQAARYAFGFSNIIDPDEYDRFGATPHDPAMLQAQMQLAGPDHTDDEPELPIDTPGHITTHPDYVQGQRDYAAGRSEPHFEIEEDETRLALWRQGYFAAVGNETEER